MATPTTSPIPAGVPPDQIQDYLDAQKQQMLAGVLMNAFQRSSQTPESWNSMRVVPKRSPLQNLSTLASALLAGNATSNSANSQARLAMNLNNAYTPGGQMTSPGTPLQPAPPASDPNEQSVRSPIAQPNGQSFQQTLAATQPQYSPTNPRNPWGLPADVVRNVAMSDPAKYAEMLRGTPEYQNALRAAGGDPNLAQQLMLGQATKAGTSDARGGSWVRGPDGKWMQLPNAGPGQNLQLGPNGEVTSQEIPGYVDTQAKLKGAETGATEAAEAPYTMVTVHRPDGGTTQMPLSDYLARVRGQSGASAGPTPLGASATPGTAAGAAPPSPALVAGPGAPAGAPSAGPIPPTAGPPVRAPAAPPAAAGAGNVPKLVTPDPWANIPKMPNPQGLGQTPGTYQQEVMKLAAEKHAKLVDQTGAAAALADQRINYNLEAAKHLAGADTGPAAEWLNEARGYMTQFGVAPQSTIDKVTDTTEASKYLINGALRNGKDLFGSRFTQSEVGADAQSRGSWYLDGQASDQRARAARHAEIGLRQAERDSIIRGFESVWGQPAQVRRLVRVEFSAAEVCSRQSGEGASDPRSGRARRRGASAGPDMSSLRQNYSDDQIQQELKRQRHPGWLIRISVNSRMPIFLRSRANASYRASRRLRSRPLPLRMLQRPRVLPLQPIAFRLASPASFGAPLILRRRLPTRSRTSSR